MSNKKGGKRNVSIFSSHFEDGPSDDLFSPFLIKSIFGHSSKHHCLCLGWIPCLPKVQSLLEVMGRTSFIDRRWPLITIPGMLNSFWSPLTAWNRHQSHQQVSAQVLSRSPHLVGLRDVTEVTGRHLRSAGHLHTRAGRVVHPETADMGVDVVLIPSSHLDRRSSQSEESESGDETVRSSDDCHGSWSCHLRLGLLLLWLLFLPQH